MRRPAEWTKMLLLDLAREGIWVESVLTGKGENEGMGEWDVRGRLVGNSKGRRSRREINGPMDCDPIISGKLRRRLGCEARRLGRGDRYVVLGVRRRRQKQRQCLRPRRTIGGRRVKPPNLKICVSL